MNLYYLQYFLAGRAARELLQGGTGHARDAAHGEQWRA